MENKSLYTTWRLNMENKSLYTTVVFNPPVQMTRKWIALSVTNVKGSPIVLVRFQDVSWPHSFCISRLDLGKGVFVDPGPTIFTKKKIVLLMSTIAHASNAPTSILQDTKHSLRNWMLSRIPELSAASIQMHLEVSKPEIVVHVEELLRNQTFGCYTRRVAELCSKLTGHKIDLKPEPPKNYPIGSFIVKTEKKWQERGFTSSYGALQSRIDIGETVFIVDGVQGFGTNIFGFGTSMKIDGTVSGSLDTHSARPATEKEIIAFVSKASVRALIILAEILEGRRK
jgi:hypothetical protein